jgi:hypothetical protein
VLDHRDKRFLPHRFCPAPRVLDVVREEVMKKRLASLMVWPMLAAWALYGQQDGRYDGHGYGWFSVDKPAHAGWELHSAGGGGEALIYRGLAAGADLAYLWPRGAAGQGIGLLSANGAYHFVNRERRGRFVPFVTAGYSLAFRSGTANLFNWGGGATYWFTDHAGMRVEVRDLRWRGREFDTTVRFGVAFR